MTQAKERSADAAECAHGLGEQCGLRNLAADACERCERFARLLDTVNELYGDTVWAITPEGVLQELHRPVERLLPEPGDPGFPREPALIA
jgi:hypothetical protein